MKDSKRNGKRKEKRKERNFFFLFGLKEDKKENLEKKINVNNYKKVSNSIHPRAMSS